VHEKRLFRPKCRITKMNNIFDQRTIPLSLKRVLNSPTSTDAQTYWVILGQFAQGCVLCPKLYPAAPPNPLALHGLILQLRLALCVPQAGRPLKRHSSTAHCGGSMSTLVTGLHHVTACAGGAQEDIDFFTQVVGQRLIKQTILFDGRYAHYHLYYANAQAEPGSVMTTFPYKRVKGRKGSGQISAATYTVSKGTLPFWMDHLGFYGTQNCGIQERFGTQFIRFSHPAGLDFEVMEDAQDRREGWSTPQIAKSEAVRGFHGVVLSVRETTETKRFFVDALGFRETGVDGSYHRLEVAGGGAGRTITLLHEPDRPAGSWTFGEGTPHHVALDVADDQALAEQKALYDELGYTDCSEIKDRNYFHSIYCRCPGGILVECAATAAGGFAKDEPFAQLGTHLLLPPWFEERRAEIVAMLEPIRVPETNNPVTSVPGMQPSRRSPVFVPAEREKATRA
jgi:glyoxalase family protein